MTIQEALGRLDSQKHNTYSEAEKRSWLTQLDCLVTVKLHNTHELPCVAPGRTADAASASGRAADAASASGQPAPGTVAPGQAAARTLPPGTLPSYDCMTDPDTVLLIPEPYSEIYLRWMEARISYLNGETQLYNEAIALYNSLWQDYANYFNRTCKPKAARLRYF